jgi:hypothetical protein
VWLGEVEAASEEAAILKGAEAFNRPPGKLIAVRKRVKT